jgi:hypothetical protein
MKIEITKYDYVKSEMYPGFPKIQCIRDLRNAVGLSLIEAKDFVDAFIAYGRVELEVHDAEVLNELRRLGFIVRIKSTFNPDIEPNGIVIKIFSPLGEFLVGYERFANDEEKEKILKFIDNFDDAKLVNFPLLDKSGFLVLSGSVIGNSILEVKYIY